MSSPPKPDIAHAIMRVISIQDYQDFCLQDWTDPEGLVTWNKAGIAKLSYNALHKGLRVNVLKQECEILAGLVRLQLQCPTVEIKYDF